MKSKECCNCGNFGAYYTKGFCYFNKTRHGFCSKHLAIKEIHDGCDFWRRDTHTKGLRKAIARRALTDILINLSAIKQILEEEQEEEKNERL